MWIRDTDRGVSSKEGRSRRQVNWKGLQSSLKGLGLSLREKRQVFPITQQSSYLCRVKPQLVGRCHDVSVLVSLKYRCAFYGRTYLEFISTILVRRKMKYQRFGKIGWNRRWHLRCHEGKKLVNEDKIKTDLAWIADRHAVEEAKLYLGMERFRRENLWLCVERYLEQNKSNWILISTAVLVHTKSTVLQSCNWIGGCC